MTDKNTILAIILSAVVLIGWQYFVGLPQQKKQLAQQQQQSQLVKKEAAEAGKTAPQAPSAPNGAPQAPGQSGQAGQPAPVTAASRAQALKASPRVAIQTPSIEGSIALKGARIDDVSLVKFHETVDKDSPPIVLLSPSGSADPFYAAFGWTAGAGSKVKLPTDDTLWKQEGSGPLTVSHPVTLTWDNGEGLTVPPHDLHRQQVPVHRQGRGHQQGRRRRSRSILTG